MIHIFIAYSSKDLAFKDEIRKRLRPLQRAGKVEIWDNYDIEAGKDWDAEVQEKLESSELILLLLSPDALDSDYFYETEAPIALRRHAAGEAIAVGVLLRPCDLKYTPFGDLTKYELLPKKGKPIVDPQWHNPDEAYLTVFQEVDGLVEKLEAKRNAQKSIAVVVNHPSAAPTIEQDADGFLQKDQKWKNGQVIRDIPEGPEMVFVEGGRFVMGSDLYKKTSPIHPVSIKPFWLGKYPVTFDEYDYYCTQIGKEKSEEKNGWGRGRRPVINITWYDAQLYCQWLSDLTKQRYRLPSEAEWEFAAIGGVLSQNFTFSGSNDLDEVGWYWKNSGSTKLTGNWSLEKIRLHNCKTRPVGKLEANELGLHDMSGNVEEWCQDVEHWDYNNAPSDGSPWETLKSNTRVLRGGNFMSELYQCSVRMRQGYLPNLTAANYGFRVARDL